MRDWDVWFSNCSPFRSCFIQLYCRYSNNVWPNEHITTQNKEQRDENNIFVIWDPITLKKFVSNYRKLISSLWYINLVCGSIQLIEIFYHNKIIIIIIFSVTAAQRGLWHPGHTRILDNTQRRATVGRTPLHEWSARRSDLYLTTHNTHNRQTSMPLVGFEPMIAAGERPYTYALDRAATGTDIIIKYNK
jgi:hypothetical protein